MFRNVLHGICLVGALGLASGCAAFQRPDARVVDARFGEASLSAATLTFDVEVDNPYGFDLPLQGVDYALASGGTKFLDGGAELGGAVPAMASKTVPVPVRIRFAELISLVESARPGVEIPYVADLGLTVAAPALGPIRVPTRREGVIAIPTASEALDRLRELGR